MFMFACIFAAICCFDFAATTYIVYKINEKEDDPFYVEP